MKWKRKLWCLYSHYPDGDETGTSFLCFSEQPERNTKYKDRFLSTTNGYGSSFPWVKSARTLKTLSWLGPRHRVGKSKKLFTSVLEVLNGCYDHWISCTSFTWTQWPPGLKTGLCTAWQRGHLRQRGRICMLSYRSVKCACMNVWTN